MIESFRHKGLRLLFEDDNAKGVNAEHVRKLKQILATLHAAGTIEAMRLPTFGLHAFRSEGLLGGYCSRELARYFQV
jgi:proteic killer suppression protein